MLGNGVERESKRFYHFSNQMQLNPFIKFLSRSFFWLIPAFLLCGVSATALILPGLRPVVESVASVWFYKEQVLLYDTKGDQWYIRTNLLTKAQPVEANQHRRWTIFLKPILIYTLGFPILWAWFLATPQRRIFNLIIGNAILFGLTVFTLGLKLFFLVANITASGGANWIYNAGFLEPAPVYSVWLVTLIGHIHFFMSYLCSGLAVPIIWYAFNRDLIKKMIER
ncbi:membrane protein [Beggiatoa sp. SS]|nr:membrane protein [Beggiatoa sp. SS]